MVTNDLVKLEWNTVVEHDSHIVGAGDSSERALLADSYAVNNFGVSSNLTD
jgi:hypothetical protein